MKSDLKAARELLENEDLKIAAIRDGIPVLKGNRKSVLDLMDLLNNRPNDLQGACAADRIVGSAAALLFIHGGISALYARTLSAGALKILENAKIETVYDKLVDFIANRAGDGMCPLESLCRNVDDPAEAFRVIREFLEK